MSNKVEQIVAGVVIAATMAAATTSGAQAVNLNSTADDQLVENLTQQFTSPSSHQGPKSALVYEGKKGEEMPVGVNVGCNVIETLKYSQVHKGGLPTVVFSSVPTADTRFAFIIAAKGSTVAAEVRPTSNANVLEYVYNGDDLLSKWVTSGIVPTNTRVLEKNLPIKYTSCGTPTRSEKSSEPVDPGSPDTGIDTGCDNGCGGPGGGNGGGATDGGGPTDAGGPNTSFDDTLNLKDFNKSATEIAVAEAIQAVGKEHINGYVRNPAMVMAINIS